MSEGGVEVLEFGSACPKCLCPFAEARWCRGCDDCITIDHLHLVCAGCRHRRINKCADTRKPPAAPGSPGPVSP